MLSANAPANQSLHPTAAALLLFVVFILSHQRPPRCSAANLDIFYGSQMHDMPLLETLEELLVKEIPRRVATLELRDPVYCLRIWYYGGDTDLGCPPSLMLPRESVRRTAQVEKGVKSPHFIWCADELGSWRDTTRSYWVEIENPTVSDLCSRWYTRMPALDWVDSEDLPPFREMLQRVSARLNRIAWQQYANVTDDFVVFPADASHTFCADYDEMVASVPPERIEYFRAKGLLGPVEWWHL